MKKRLLSMLLLVAMIVTALPIVALPAFAAEEGEKEYAAEDYDALYVKTGLLLAADFFKTNSYWNTENEAYVPPVGPSEMTAYEYGDRTYNFKEVETDRLCYRLVKGGAYYSDTEYPTKEAAEEALAALDATAAEGVTVLVAATAAFLEAFDTWKTADRAYLLGFTTHQTPISPTSSSLSYLYSYTPAFGPTQTSAWSTANNHVARTYSVFTQGEGYIQIRPDAHSSGGLQMGNISATTGTAATQQFVMAPGGSLKTSFLIMNGARFALAKSGDAVTITSAAAASSKYTNETDAVTGLTFKDSATEVIDFTASLSYGTLTDGTYVGTVATARTENGLLFSSKGDYKADASQYLGWSTTASNAKVYAVRHYNRVLSEAEIAQNHFADLCKFFRLDLSLFEKLTKEELANVYADAIAYSLDDDRAAVAEALYASAKDELRARYDAYEGQLDAAILAAAKEHLLDVSLILGIPRGVLPTTYKFLLALANGTADSTDPAADYEAAVAADIAAYAAGSVMTADDYNALYAGSGLVFGVDFFASNAHWGGSATTFTDNAAFQKAITESIWRNTSGVTFGKLASGKTIVIKDGYLDLSGHSDFALSGVHKATGGGFDHGATVEHFQQAIGGGIMFNNLRAYFSKATNKFASLQVQSDKYMAFTSADYTGPAVEMFSRPATFAMSYSLPTPLSSRLWGDKTLSGGTMTASASHTGYVGEWIAVEGEEAPVLSVAAETTTFIPFFHPSARLVEKVEYQAGVKLETPLENVLVYFPNEQAIEGSVAMYEDGKVLHASDNVPFLNNAAAYDAAYIKWSTVTSNLYAIRYYNRVLSPEEVANNSFIDLAKWFRLSLTGYDVLSDEDKATVWAAFEGITANSDRVEAQATLLRALAPLAKETYDAMKVPGNDALNAFLDVAADYSLDVKAVMSSDRDMSTVYKAVTAEALTGKSVAEAQAILDEAVFDAYHYLSYCVDPEKAGAESWNAQLVRCAEICDTEKNVDLEGLMVLPWSVRSQVTVPFDSYEAAQTYVDAFVADALAAYGADGYVDYDYDSLYVQEGLAFALDFFKTNSYWNTDGVTYTAPVGPTENTAFEYEGKTYDLTKTENRYGWGLVKSNAWVDDTVYATKTEAEAAAAALGDSAVTVNERVTPVFEAAWNAWASADRAYLMSFTTKGNFALFSYQPGFAARNVASYNIASYNTAKSFSTFTQGDGFIEIRNGIHSSGGLQLSGANDVATDNVSLQVTTAFNVPVNAGAKTFMILHNVRPTYTSTANSLSFHSVATNNFTISGSLDSKNTLPNTHNTAISLTVTLEGLVDADADDAVVIRTPASEIASASGAIVRNSASDTNYFSYGGSPAGQRIYAIRYYNEALTEADLAQNHFADLAKFFRLDLSLYALMDDALRAELHEAFLAYDIASADRAELSATLSAVGAKLFDGMTLIEDEEANATFLTMAAAGALDLDRIVNLGAEAKASVVEAMLDEFLPCYVLNGVIVGTVYDELTLSLGAMTFAGYQVRIDTGVAAANYAGVRAVFNIDKAIVAELLKTTDEVVLTVNVAAVGGGTATLTVTCTQGDGDVAIAATLKVGDAEAIPATVYERELADGSKTLSVNYTVTYKGEAFTKANLTQELAYSYAIKAGAASYDFAVTSERFGNTVTAAEVYAAFAAMDQYASDPVVGSVLDAVK